MALKRVTKPKTFRDWGAGEKLAYAAGWAICLIYTITRVAEMGRPGDSDAVTIGLFLGLLAVRVLPAWLVMWLVQDRERGKPGQEKATRPAIWWLVSHILNGIILIPFVFLFTHRPTLIDEFPDEEEDAATLEIQEVQEA